MSFRTRLAELLGKAEIPLDIGMAALACAYIVIGEYNDGMFGNAPTTLSYAAEIAITVIFVVEYAVRFYAAQDRGRFVRTHVIDLLALISTLRLLRGLQFLRLLRILRLARLAVFIRTSARLARVLHHASNTFTDPILAYGVIGITAMVFFGALALLEFERGFNPNIRDFNDAFWSAFSIILTVGFSSAKPVTPEGRVVSGVLVVAGLTCISFFTTSLTVRLQQKHLHEHPRLERIEALLETLLKRTGEKL
ncbi:MAG: ion transporter [Candidatus Eremiobacteraeota bacterium]|nr:ion transporter [Candidatus Eremiobacteraeota bacterium]